MKTTRQSLAVVFVMLAVSDCGTPVALAQADKQPASENPSDFKIFHLQNASAASAAAMLGKLFPEINALVTADERTNSLVVRAQDSALQLIEAILLNLDQAAAKRPKDNNPAPAGGAEGRPQADFTTGDDAVELRIFELRHAPAVQTLRVVSELYPKEQFVADERTNSIFIRASRKRLAEIEEFLDSRDRPDAKSPPSIAPAGSPEFQQYEQQSRAAAQAYRQRLQVAPRDEAKLAQLKADVQGAVHSAFHARQSWQRKQAAELRQRLDEIEKNISARSQRSNEIIERRVQELLNPDAQWETANPAGADAAATDRPYLSNDLSGFPTGPGFQSARLTPESVWLSDHQIAQAKFRRSKRPLVYYFYKSGEPEPPLLTSDEMLSTLSAGFIAVKMNEGSEANWVLTTNDVPSRNFPFLLIVTKEDETFGPYELFKGEEDGARIIAKLREVQAATSAPVPQSNQPPVVVGMGGGMMGGWGNIPGAGSTASTNNLNAPQTVSPIGIANPAQSVPQDDPRGADQESNRRMTRADSERDPRRELLEAENALAAAQIEVEYATTDSQAAETELAQFVAANKSGAVPQSQLVRAQTAAKLKAVALTRAKAELLGKQRILDLAKEQLAEQVKICEAEVKQMKALFELAAKDEARANAQLQKGATSHAKYEKTQAELEAARLNVVRAESRYAHYRKVLPATAGEKRE